VIRHLRKLRRAHDNKGTPLSQGDFVMSKIAADEIHGGNTLRKVIDYFCHLSVVPNHYEYIKNNDKDFVATGYLDKLAWLVDDKETACDHGCDDFDKFLEERRIKNRIIDLYANPIFCYLSAHPTPSNARNCRLRLCLAEWRR